MSNLKYALTVNPTIYTSCIKQFWATTKAKTVNGEVQIQAQVDGKKVIVTETSVKRALYAKTIAWNEFSSTMASAIICLATNQKFYFSKYIFNNMVKNLEGRVKFLMYPRFVQVFLDKQVEGMSKHKKIYVTPSHTKKVFAYKMRKMKNFSGTGHTLISNHDSSSTINQPSSSQLPKKQKPRKSKKHNTETSQAAEITKLKERVKKLERRNKSRTPGLKRLRKVSRTARIESSEDKGLGDQEDASKQGRKITNIDADEEEVEVEKVVSTAEVTTASATTTTVDELTLAQTLIEIKAAKPKAVTTAATTTTTAVTRPKARGVVVQEPSEFTTTTSPSQPSQLPQAKDKGKEKMVEPEKPLKKKDQILIDEEIAQRLQEELQAKLEEEERLARQKEEDANIAEWDNVQAMIDADYELAARLQAQEQEELTIEERSKMFVELMDKRKKHFARLRAEEQRRKPPTKAQKRSQIYGYETVKERLFKAEMVQESSFKRTGEELESDNSKKKKLDENVEAEVDDEAEMKKHTEIVLDDEVAIDAIPLATKPPIIVDWKIIKKNYGILSNHQELVGSLRRYSSMIKMLQNIDREDLEPQELVKVKLEYKARGGI
ncbi:hypothetical protein Tco_0510527 [Tanacetum coccineum]